MKNENYDLVPKLDMKRVSQNTNATPPTTNRGMEGHLDFHQYNSVQSQNTFKPSPVKNYYRQKCQKLLLEKEKYTQNLRDQKVQVRLLQNEISYLKTQSSPSPQKSYKNKENFSLEKCLYL
jgi:hypothetical protein